MSAAPPRVTSVREALAGGPRAVGTRILGRTVYRRLEWLEVRRDGPLAEIEPAVPLQSRFLGPDDAAEIAVLRRDLGEAGVLARFADHDRCFGSRHEGRLVSTICGNGVLVRQETVATPGWLGVGPIRRPFRRHVPSRGRRSRLSRYGHE